MLIIFYNFQPLEFFSTVFLNIIMIVFWGGRCTIIIYWTDDCRFLKPPHPTPSPVCACIFILGESASAHLKIKPTEIRFSNTGRVKIFHKRIILCCTLRIGTRNNELCVENPSWMCIFFVNIDHNGSNIKFCRASNTAARN